MSQIYPAMKGNMGVTEYYMVTIKAGALIEMAKVHTKDKNWEELTLEERDQREINLTRVKTKIAPYFAKSRNHFMSSIVLLGENLDPNCFESLVSDALIASTNIPQLYQNVAQTFGFLNLTGGEIFKILDGQHRVMALRYAIRGRDFEDKEISTDLIDPNAAAALAQEDISAIIVRADNKQARKIFNDINSYAKPTTTGQNLITNDEKTNAVFARRVTNKIISPNLVNYRSNNLTEKDKEFTTLATVAKATESIIKAFHGKDYVDLPQDESKQKALWNIVEEYWKVFLKEFLLWEATLRDKSEKGDEKRKEDRRCYLCMRPLTQLAIVTAGINSVSQNVLSVHEAIDKLNMVPWETEAKLWDRVLWSGGKVQTKNAGLVTGLLEYLLMGEQYADKDNLRKKYIDIFPSDHQPTDLPEWDNEGRVKINLLPQKN